MLAPVTRITLFHHVLGLTDGIRGTAAALRAAGHEVRVPDLYDGRTFASISEGFAHATEIGFDELHRRAAAAVADEPADIVLGGFSLGVMLAQQLLQTRPGARGGLFFHSFVDPSSLEGAWPEGTPVRILATDRDPFFVDDGDLAAAQEWQRAHPELEIVQYPGGGHLFLEPGTPEHDPEAAQRAIADARDFLAELDGPRV